jgi:hypothetical protein
MLLLLSLEKPFKNPQTETFARLLNIQNKINPDGQDPIASD